VTELVRGQISDRPWGLTFGQLGLREITGQLTLRATDGRDYRVAFEHGAIVGAVSPQPADSATRIAMTSGLITSTQVAVVAKQIAATPEIDEIALLASAARLQVEQIAGLRRKVIAQRAARTFSVEAGSFVVEDKITIPVAPDAAADVRAVVLQGARMNLSEQRLATELRGLGSFFQLGDTALEHASWFGIDKQELPILDALRLGTTLPEIEAKHREIDPRTVQAVLYALIACRECTVTTLATPRAKTSSSESVQVSFTKRPSQEHIIPTSLDASLMARTSTAKGATPTSLTPPARANTAADEFRHAAGTNSRPTRKAYNDDSVALPQRTAAPSSPPPVEVKDKGTGPFARVPTTPPRDKPPSTPPVVTPRTISSGSVTVARTQSSPVLTPRTISNSVSAPVYSEGSDRVSQSIDEAAEAHKRGLEALKAGDLPLAVEQLGRAASLNPHEFEYSAMSAWAIYLNATAAERSKLVDKTRRLLTHAAQKSRDPAHALTCLGQFERLVGGRDKQALAHFRAALATKPDHQQAMLEIQQLEEKALEKSGFGLFKKK
jgi:hypothetical protein